MLTVQNLSSNPAPVTVWSLVGNSNVVSIPSGAKVDVPGVRLPTGESIFGGLKLSGTVLVTDGASGQVQELYAEGSQLDYCFQGAVLGLSAFGVIWLLRLIRRGVTLSRHVVYD